MTTKNSSRDDRLAADQGMVDGIQKNQAKLPASFPMEGGTQTLQGVSQVFQERVATGKAVIVADNAQSAAIKDDRDKRAQTRGTALAFKRLLIALFAQEPDVLGDFAVDAPKKAQRSAADKAKAAEKGMATRKTLGTKGSRQKKAALQQAEAASAAPVTDFEARELSWRRDRDGGGSGPLTGPPRVSVVLRRDVEVDAQRDLGAEAVRDGRAGRR